MSVDAVVNRLGVSCEKIIKSILFVDDADQPVLGIVTRDKRVSERKLAMACGAKNVRIANPYFFIWWATIGAALITKALAFGVIGFLLFAVTHWSCNLLWDTFVSVTVFKSRRF